MSPMQILTKPISRAELRGFAAERFGDMVKAVVDCKRNMIAIGGDLHADEEQMLLDQGSAQEDLWGINLYPDRTDDSWIEFDSMINIRPRQNNRSRSVESVGLQKTIRTVVSHFIQS